ncbi:hypothetical protein LUZ60_016710 [Juncus effusus]|nr:hypothetical protein LUZ60_016710 [Juncus effusus]
MEFVKNLVEKVEKASKKQIGCGINSLHSEEVNPVLAFHYGVPSESSLLAFDPVQQILAVATRNGQIKLFGRDNTQALLQSENAIPCKILKFMVNQGVLLNVNIQNQIEVWDIESRRLSHVHTFKEDISSFTVLQQSPYIYIGDISGNVSLFKLDHKLKHLVEMPYRIPFSKSYGESASQVPVMHILPQPFAESKRVLIIFKDGLITLWDIHSSELIFSTGKTSHFTPQTDGKSVISTCWACTYGSKLAVGYTTGDLYLYSIPLLSANESSCNKSPRKDQNAPVGKINLGLKLERVPVVGLKWVCGDNGKLSRLYVNGFSEDPLYHSFQVIILNETSEARTVKLVLPLTEPCLQTEIISLNNKHKQNALAVLLKSGQICLYDDSEIERYLHNCQSNNKSSTLPSQIKMDLPFFSSVVSCANLYTSNGNGSILSPKFEEYGELLNRSPNFLSINAKDRDMKSNLVSANSGNLSKNKSLYITGHLDGTINFWDSSSPLLLLIFSIKQQNGAPITSLYFDVSSKVVISGDQNGQVRIITFKKDSSSDNMFSFLQAKPGENYTIKGLKLQGSIVSININSNFKHLAVGTDKGLLALVNTEEASIIYQKQIQGQVSSGIISMQFEKFVQEGFEKNILLILTEDSSVLAFEEESGNDISPNSVHTKNPSRALLMHVLEATSEDSLSPTENSSRETASKNNLLLLCSENAVRLYSLTHAIQGIKKQISKKRLSCNCCYASIIQSLSHGLGLMLVFTNGKIEIRSLPDLNLLKETSLRGFKFPKNPNSCTALSASSDGDLIMVNGDQEISFYSTLSQKESYRYIEYLSAVYKKDSSQLEESNYIPISPKEKKMGLFEKVMKDLKGNKGKNNEEFGHEYSSRKSFEKLSTILEASNFPIEDERRISSGKEDQNQTAELTIDDIEIEDSPESKEKNKAQQFAALSKQKFGKGLQVLKGKLKPKTAEKLSPVKNKTGDEAAGSSVDQIKAKYGFSTNNDTNANAKMAESKLRENVKKLEGINDKSAEMTNSAQNFSMMANELLKTLENEKK